MCFFCGLLLLFNGAGLWSSLVFMGWISRPGLHLNATSNQFVVSSQSYSMSFVRQWTITHKWTHRLLWNARMSSTCLCQQPSTVALNAGSSPGETWQPLFQLLSPRGLHHPIPNVSFNQLPKIKALDLLVQAGTQHLRIGTDTRLTPCANGPSWYCSTSRVSFLYRAQVTAARGQTACSLLMAHIDNVCFWLQFKLQSKVNTPHFIRLVLRPDAQGGECLDL